LLLVNFPTWPLPSRHGMEWVRSGHDIKLLARSSKGDIVQALVHTYYGRQ